MKILFVGDICFKNQNYNYKDFCKIKTSFDHIFGNLEGAISFEDRHDIVCNSESVIHFLRHCNISFVSLTNNHTFDDDNLFVPMISFLKKNNIASFGAGKTLAESRKPLVFASEKREVRVLLHSFGWDVIGCKIAGKNSPGVNPLNTYNLFNTIYQVRKSDDESVVIFMFHWNFELELYPQPMYRQLSRDLIDAGVDAIVGMHPHVAQGAELYKGKPIVYSLGNWFFPPRKLGSMVLKFPEIANRQLALELDIKSRAQIRTKFHWFQFKPDDCSINFEATEDWSGEILHELTPFREMNHTEYSEWFKKHRRKSFFLPIYYNYHDKLANYFKDCWVKARQLIIKLLLKCKLKNSPN